MKKFTEGIKNTVLRMRNLLGRLLGAPASKPALQPVPVRSRRVIWRK